MKNRLPLFTIGHSNRSLDDFLALLKQNGIDAVADVRSSPFSRHMPHFNQVALRQSLSLQSIQYVFLGQELGARRHESECYVDGVARYDLIEKTEAYARGLKRIRNGISKFRIALMCAEKDPLTCHRTILIGRSLRNEYELNHVVSNDCVLTQDELEKRLLSKWNFSQPELFDHPKDLLEEAYQRQAELIAFSKPLEEQQAGGQHG